MKKKLYTIRFSNRAKRLRLEVVLEEVRVVAPVGMSVSTIDEFVTSKKNWIEGKIEQFNQFKSMSLPVSYESCTELSVLGKTLTIPLTKNSEVKIVKWLDAQLMEYLTGIMKRHTQFVPSAIRLGNARTRWGSCSSRGVVMINRKLVHAPTDVVEYVLVHELVHLKHRNHSSRFWSEVVLIYGDVRSQKKWLRLQGAYLI